MPGSSTLDPGYCMLYCASFRTDNGAVSDIYIIEDIRVCK